MFHSMGKHNHHLLPVFVLRWHLLVCLCVLDVFAENQLQRSSHSLHTSLQKLGTLNLVNAQL